MISNMKTLVWCCLLMGTISRASDLQVLLDDTTYAESDNISREPKEVGKVRENTCVVRNDMTKSPEMLKTM